MLKFKFCSLNRSHSNWILIFCTKKCHTLCAELRKIPWLLKKKMLRWLLRKEYLTPPVAIFSFSVFWYFHIEIDFYYWPRDDTQDDNVLSIQCHFSSWIFVEIFSPSFLLPDRAVFPYSNLSMYWLASCKHCAKWKEDPRGRTQHQSIRQGYNTC